MSPNGTKPTVVTTGWSLSNQLKLFIMAQIVNYLDAPVPEKTKSYTPVPHDKLIEFTEARLEEAGFKRSTLEVDQTPDGNIIIANMGIEKTENSEFTQMLTVINSYNKARPVTFASGAKVFVCSNGMIISEMTTVRRHTTYVWNELQEKADTAISQLTKNWEKTQHDVEVMKNFEMGIPQMYRELGTLTFDKRIINPTEANIIYREMRWPTFSDFNDPTLWKFYNACTFALKEAHPYRKNNSLKSVHDYCLQLAN